MADPVDYVARPFKALKMHDLFQVTNAKGVSRIGMPGDYEITYADNSKEVMSAKKLESQYQVKT